MIKLYSHLHQQKVVRLDVGVDDVAAMQMFDDRQDLAAKVHHQRLVHNLKTDRQNGLNLATCGQANHIALTLVVAVRILLFMSSSEPYWENSDTRTLAFGAITAEQMSMKPGN